MFSKRPGRKEDDAVADAAARPAEASPKPPPPPMPQSGAASGSQATPSTSMQSSVIGNELSVSGNIASEGELQVEGRIEGDVRCMRLIISPTARVVGEVSAEDVIVNGHLEGDIRGLRVTLQSNANVEGDIYHQSLGVEDGAFFEGSSRRSDDPMKGAGPKSEAAGKSNGAPARSKDDDGKSVETAAGASGSPPAPSSGVQRNPADRH